MSKSTLPSVEIPPRVVFVNIKDGTVFFDCSPAEARAAVDEIKRFRERKTTIPELIDRVKMVWSLVANHKKRAIKLDGPENELTINSLNLAFAQMEKTDHIVHAVCMNPVNYANVRGFGKSVYDEATTHEIEAGIFAHIWTADILISSDIKKNTYYLVSLPFKRRGYSPGKGFEEFEDEPKIIKVKFGIDMKKFEKQIDPRMIVNIIDDSVKKKRITIGELKEFILNHENSNIKENSDTVPAKDQVPDFPTNNSDQDVQVYFYALPIGCQFKFKGATFVKAGEESAKQLSDLDGQVKAAVIFEGHHGCMISALKFKQLELPDSAIRKSPNRT